MKRVLVVGQCSADFASIRRLLQTRFGADVLAADIAQAAAAALQGGEFDLMLVNRVLDMNGASGLDLIALLRSDGTLGAVPTMLVSNYPDAQAEAIAAGCLPGFGKARLHDPATHAALAAVLEPATA